MADGKKNHHLTFQISLKCRVQNIEIDNKTANINVKIAVYT